MPRLGLVAATLALGCGIEPRVALDASPQDAADATIDATAVDTPPGTPAIATVAIVGQDDNQVRQGTGRVRIRITGSDLAAPLSVAVEGDAAAIISATDSEILADWTILHGATPGPRGVIVQTPGGLDSLLNAVSVTPITVGPLGADSTARGTTSTPFRTISAALRVAGPDDTVFVRDGQYGDLDVWPLYIGSRIHLQGESRAGVRIAASPTTEGIAVYEGAVVESFTVTGQTRCIVMNGATARNFSATDCAIGVVVQGLGGTVQDASIGATTIGIYGLLGTNGTDSTRLAVERVDVTRSSGTYDTWAGLRLQCSGGGPALISNVTITDTAPAAGLSAAVALSSDQGGAPVQLWNVTLLGSVNALRISGVPNVELRMSSSAMSIGGAAGIAGACIADERQSPAVGSAPLVHLGGVSVCGQVQTSGIVTGPAQSRPFYYIREAGSAIEF
ncbi:MAG: DUF1565 domain-containing protein [Myxococcales bacterium]|nr:DUF1565 domain-containing protein [Myxococcales bacterium]MBK7192750.1 DUF1565 domain-containing protein [Myxococcales bacterium]